MTETHQSGIASPLSVTRLAKSGGERPARRNFPLWLAASIRASMATDSAMRFHKYIYYCLKNTIDMAINVKVGVFKVDRLFSM